MHARNPSSQTPTCHRCHQPMTFSAKETVAGQTLNVFRCNHCGTLEAFEDKAANDAA